MTHSEKCKQQIVKIGRFGKGKKKGCREIEKRERQEAK